MGISEIGLEEAFVKRLQTHIKSAKLSRSYIISGEKSRMGFQLAVAFAKIVSCENMDYDFCDECKNCKMINGQSHPDIQIYKSEKTKFGIDIVRKIQQDSSQTNYRTDVRVNIIVDAHTMTIPAQNALLKTLEDNASHCLTILLTEVEKSILPTIYSRSILLRLPPLTRSRVIQILANHGLEETVAGQEFDESGGDISWLIWLLENKEKGEKILATFNNQTGNITNILEVAGDTEYHEGLKILLPQIISRASLEKRGQRNNSTILKSAVAGLSEFNENKLTKLRCELVEAEKLWNTGIKKTTLLQKTLIPLMR